MLVCFVGLLPLESSFDPWVKFGIDELTYLERKEGQFDGQVVLLILVLSYKLLELVEEIYSYFTQQVLEYVTNFLAWNHG